MFQERDFVPSLGENENIAAPFIYGLDSTSTDPVRAIEAQDTLLHSRGTIITQPRVPYTYLGVLAALGAIVKREERPPGFKIGHASLWAFSNAVLASNQLIETQKISYDDALADLLTSGLTFAEVFAERASQKSGLSIRAGMSDILDVGPHVQLPPKRSREIRLQITKRRKGELPSIEPTEIISQEEAEPDILDVGPHVQLPPKRSREIRLQITKRRKGELPSIEPQDL